MHKSPGSRLAKLERLARERPCPRCGRAYSLHRAIVELPELNRLDATEQGELVGLLGTAATAPCVRCGHSGHDIAHLTDDQKRRTLALLRVLLGEGGRRP